jgi:N-acetylglucosaminyldiphosphoundecaprenol N-acetyl-beta-D-mannosaminyltransferase
MVSSSTATHHLPADLLALTSSCFDGGLEAAADRVVAHAIANRGGYVCLCNVHVLVTALHDASLRETIEGAELRLPDGAPVAWLLRALGSRHARRVGGPDLLAFVLDRSRDGLLRHFFAGSTERELEALTRLVARTWQGVEIVGHHAPRFAPQPPIEESLARIRDSGAQLVWVGLGAPKQELWMARAACALPDVTFVGVGAAFDFVAGSKPRAPEWMQGVGLEWLFRMMSEPRRLGGRYLRTNSEFIALTAVGLTRRRLDER